jgi:hypothetical protein
VLVLVPVALVAVHPVVELVLAVVELVEEEQQPQLELVHQLVQR